MFALENCTNNTVGVRECDIKKTPLVCLPHWESESTDSNIKIRSDGENKEKEVS